MKSQLLDRPSRSFPVVGALAILVGVALLFGIEFLPHVLSSMGGYGKYVWVCLALFFLIWGLRQAVMAIKPNWAISRMPRWNRHRMTPTREGLVYITFMSVMFIGSILGKSNMLMLVFAMMIGPWVLNGWIAFSMLRRTNARRDLPHRATAGELVSVDVEVGNGKWMIPSWLLAAQDRIVHHRDSMTAATLFVRVPARQKRRGTYFVRLSQRGVYSFGPIELVTSFPLGLVERGMTCHEFRNDDSTRLIVHPPIGQLTSRWRREIWNATEWTERRNAKSGLFDDEFHRIREFRPGDNPRAIHWRTTARQGNLMVREYQQSRDQELLLLVELWQPEYPTSSDLDRVELAISFAATALNDHLRLSRDARAKIKVIGRETFCWQQNDGPERMLDHLAVAAASSVADLRPIFDETISKLARSTRLIVISSRTPNEVSVRFRESAARERGLAISTDPAEVSAYFLPGADG